MSDQRLAFVHLVRTEGLTVAVAAARFGVSRKTGHKWLARHTLDPDAPLNDRSRAPKRRPSRTDAMIENAIVELRRQTGWGARKLHADLRSQGLAVPCIRAVHDTLRRHSLITPAEPGPDPAPGRFEREHANGLWQLDHKKFGEVERQTVNQLTVLDDHARFLLLLQPVPDLSMPPVWDALWGLFERVGMPESVLCDNAFSTRSPIRTLSWFDSRLIRAGITPLHGRGYHPQTQGKVERLHGTLERECYPRARRDRVADFHADCERWRQLYNNRRPHEALGDKPPSTRWTPSTRRRPPRLPVIEYQPGVITRRVCAGGNVQYRRYRFTAGAGLAGEHVAIEELNGHVTLRYGHVTFRRIPTEQLTTGKVL